MFITYIPLMVDTDPPQEITVNTATIAIVEPIRLDPRNKSLVYIATSRWARDEKTGELRIEPACYVILESRESIIRRIEDVNRKAADDWIASTSKVMRTSVQEAAGLLRSSDDKEN